jgi:hypothetical protein
MNLYPNWREILRKAWSVRLMAAAVILDGAQVVMQLLTPHQPSAWFIGLSAVVTMAALVARLTFQKGV